MNTPVVHEAAPPLANASHPMGGVRPASNPAEDVFRAIRKHWRLAASIAAVVTVAAWLFAAVQPKRYRATALAAVTPLTTNMSGSDVLRGLDMLDRQSVMGSIAALASTDATVQQAQAAAGDDVSARILTNTNLFTITVEGLEPQRAARVANAIPSSLDKQTRTLFRLYGVRLISPATPPHHPFVPRVLRATLSGLIAGLVLGVLAAYLTERQVWRRLRA